MKSFAAIVVSLVIASASAATTEELVGQADLIVQGRIVKVETGKLDEQALGHGIKKRTDTATIAIIEVLKGDFPEQRVEVQFPGMPGPNEPKLERGQNGIFFLAKAEGGYAVTKSEQIAEDSELGVVRRAIVFAGGNAKAEKPEARAERVAKAERELRESGSVDARKTAAFHLGDIGQMSSVPELIKALADPDGEVRVSAAMALSKITGRRIEMDFENASADERADAIAAWNEWYKNNGERPREELLLEAIQDGTKPQPDVSRALESLAKSTNKNYVQLFRRVLKNAIESKNDRMAVSAASYLGHARDEASLAMLAELLDPKTEWPSSATRAIAAGAVGEIAGKSFGTGLEAISAALDYARENAR